MAITQDEIQQIVTSVLSAIRTNSQTIDQLVPVSSLEDGDSIEITGGRRITAKTLCDLIVQHTSEVMQADFQALSDDLDVAKENISDLTSVFQEQNKKFTPVACVDEADLAAKAASSAYVAGQQFYIPEED